MLETDIKLFKSEKMNLTDDSGGRRSANVIPYGQENSIFPDISREARNRGKNLMMKIWGAVTTDDTEPYMDSVAIVSRIPDDDNVAVSIFATPDNTGDDKLPAARAYLEQGIVSGGLSPYYLYGLHNAGSGAITVWCTTDIAAPDTNSTYIISEENTQQSIRITRILANSIRTFTDSDGQFSRRILSLQLSAPLSYTFHGTDVKRKETSTEIKVQIFNTIVSDSMRIYGTSRLAESAAIGALQVAVESLNARVVPSNIAYLPSTDLNAAGEAVALQDGGSTVTFTVTFAFGPGVSLYLGASCFPGSLSIAVPAGTLVEDGGVLKSGAVTVATIDYAAGVVVFVSGAPTYSGSKTVTFHAAAPVSRVQNTYSIRITPENRGTVFIATLQPTPAPATLRVAYLSGGKWYTLRDMGNGAIGAENTAYGTGQVTYSTGSTTITLGALPDVYSSIIFTWAAAADTFNRGNIQPSKLFFEVFLTQVPATETVEVSWGNVSLTDDGAGNLTGSGGTGVVFYGEKRVLVYPTTLPLLGQTVTVTYDYGTGAGAAYDETFTSGNSGQQEVAITLAHGNVIPGSIILKYPVTYRKYTGTQGAGYEAMPIPNNENIDVYFMVVARDNKIGGWIGSNGAASYQDGTLTFSASGSNRSYKGEYDRMGWLDIAPPGSMGRALIPHYKFVGWTVTTAQISYVTGGNIHVSYQTTGPTAEISENFSISQLQFELTNDYAEPIVPRSIRFALGGSIFDDQIAGSICKDRSAQTGAATLAGSVDYQTGISTLTAWPPGGANTPTIQTLITRLQATAASSCSFRTAGAPLQSGQLSVRVTKPDGAILSATAGTNGQIVAAGIDGTADFQVGVVNLAFGTWITAAGHENEPWYDAGGVRQDGKIFRPEPVLIDTLTYSAVTVKYQPIDAESLGVDPTRFPPDGKMAIFHIGDTLIIHHTQSITLANPLPAGTVVNCERTHVTWVTLVDATGTAVPSTGRFALNSEAGTVTFANPLDLAGFTQPLTLYHTIADRSVITDLDISGIITFSKQLRHNYSAGAMVSSALQLRTLQADWDTLFSQQAWLNSWSDTRQGNPITAQYNYTQFPPLVTNHHATRQRYALIWKNGTQYDCIGESIGYVGSGDKNSDFSPTNLLTGGPLFTLRALGFGSLWSAGNVLRVNTDQVAEKSIWCLMSINPSDPGGLDKFEIRILGDINA